MLLAVGVGEGWGAALEGGAEDVDPGCEGHVEGGGGGVLGHGGDELGELELLHERDGCEEVLVPWDVGEGVIEAADGALEEDHAEGRLEDLLVVFVAVQGGAELRDGRVAVAHDVCVDGLVAVRVSHRRLVVLRRDAEAAVQVALVRLEGGQDQV